MKTGIPPYFIHFFVLVFFVLAALAYFYPVLQGRTLYQNDIAQYRGMAREQTAFRDSTDMEAYWTNTTFGGMPTYQLGANYPHDYIKRIDRLIRFLPRPADYLFLYLAGFYILLCCLRIEPRLAVLGALAFGFSTYFIIILGVGHNAKAHAIGYMPLLLAGILITFRRKYLWGFVITALAMALEVSANHYQMTYYFMLLVIILGMAYLIDYVRKKELRHYFVSVGILILAVVVGIGTNAAAIMATKQYAAWSTRGPSEVTVNPDGSEWENTEGLSREYITQYSYGITESLNIFVPRLFGGASTEDLGTTSNTFDYLTEQGLPRSRALEFSAGLPLYWGEQPGTSGPAYIGAIVCLLFLLGLFLLRGRVKWWLLAGSFMALLLSWGKNFSLLTDFMIDYFPLYDKFRAVSSIQVILELCMPLMAVLALQKYLDGEVEPDKKRKALTWSFIALSGLCILLLLSRGLFDFIGMSDATYQRFFGDEVMAMIRSDRKAVYLADTLRSLCYVALGAFALWLFLKGRVKKTLLLFILGALIVADLAGIDLRYVNEGDFVRQRVMDRPFQESATDREIKQDSGIFRVYDINEGINGARTSYFHHSIGGYHAAKPKGIQDLFEFHIYKNHMEALDMLNVRYVISQDEEGRSQVIRNFEANGNAWFVSRLNKVADANAEIQALDSLDTRTEAVVNAQKFPEVAPGTFMVDSSANITLTGYAPNRLTYRSANPHKGIAVFSEMYYPHGWNAYLNGKAVPHFRVNYALRALPLPPGTHTLEFRFEPEVVETGGAISLASSIVLALAVFGGIFFTLWRHLKKRET